MSDLGTGRQSIIFVHRWLGVVLSLLFLLWFLSGIALMYWDFPSVRDRDRLDRAPRLDPSTIRISPSEAAARASRDLGAPVVLSTLDGRPAYLFGSRRQPTIVYADTGELQHELSRVMVDRIASAWSGQPLAVAHVVTRNDVDQWTLQVRLADVTPLWKYSWADGQQVYVSQKTGEVVQYTTTNSRWGAYVGAIPHWLYFTPLRKHGRAWSRVVIWSSGVGTATAILGIAIAAWAYSPGKRYRHNGLATAVPYRGWKRWHTIIGLVSGAGAVTWAFSGMLSMDPFPAQRAGGSDERSVENAVVRSLRGRVALSAFGSKPPDDALRQLAPLTVKELELTSFANEPIYLATVAGNETRVVPVRGAPQPELDRQTLVNVLEQAVQAGGGGDVSVLEQYDRYYLDRRGVLPLPVLLARLNDPRRTRLYVDPKTARLVGSYSSDRWVNRWLYHGLHSLEFPWLYAHRPLWDVVMLTCMVAGAALSLTALVLASKVVTRKLRAGPAA